MRDTGYEARDARQGMGGTDAMRGQCRTRYARRDMRDKGCRCAKRGMRDAGCAARDARQGTHAEAGALGCRVSAGGCKREARSEKQDMLGTVCGARQRRRSHAVAR